MATPTQAQRATVIEMTQSEWDDAVRRRLERMGLTYDELAGMARRRDFVSLDAMKLWLVIGEQDQVRPGSAD